MRDLLSTMKISSSEHVFLDALADTSFAHIKPDVLSFLWNCGFTCDGRLARVAEVACEGDFQQAFEGVTLMEQVETVVDEKDLLEAQVIVGEALQSEAKSDIHPFWRRCAGICRPCMMACFESPIGAAYSIQRHAALFNAFKGARACALMALAARSDNGVEMLR